jgi:hypothetical protein
MDVSQLRRLKDLESECARLKEMYADLALAGPLRDSVLLFGACLRDCSHDILGSTVRKQSSHLQRDAYFSTRKSS